MPVAQVDGGDGVAFLVGAGLVYEIIAAACSSPQTTEINADRRAGTLMKWVHIGLIQSAGFIAAAAIIDPTHRRSIVAGGTAAAVIMYGSYYYAKACGLASDEPGTEDGPPLTHTLGRPGFSVH